MTTYTFHGNPEGNLSATQGDQGFDVDTTPNNYFVSNGGTSWIAFSVSGAPSGTWAGLVASNVVTPPVINSGATGIRATHYSDILRGTAAKAGLVMDEVGTQEFQLYREFHDHALQVAWEIHRWPELCRLEQRAFRATYDAGTTYTAGDEVLDPATQAYYQCLVTGIVGIPPSVAGVENSAYWAGCKTSYTGPDWDTEIIWTIGDQVRNPDDQQFYQRLVDTGEPDAAWDSAQWGALRVFYRTISYEQAGLTPIGEVLGAWDKDIRITTRATKLPFRLEADAINFTQLRTTFNYGWVPASTNFSHVWLLYRLRRPELTGDVFDAELVYTSGQQVYYADPATRVGDFYNALTTTTAGDSPASVPASWVKVEIPYIFRSFLITAGHSQWLEEDGKPDAAAPAWERAIQALELEADKLQRQQQQVNRIDWRNA